MATTVFNGLDTPGDLSVAANYTNGIPVSNDVLVIGKAATTNISTSMTQFAAVDLDFLLVESGCTINIGSSGNELDVAADKVVHQGSGELWYKSATALVTDWVIVDADTTSGKAYLTGVDISKVTVLKGLCDISGTGLTNPVDVLDVAHRTNAGGDATVNITSHDSPATDTVVTLTVQHAGIVTCTAAMGTVFIDGGIWEQTGIQNADLFSVGSGGYLDYRPPTGGSSEGVIAALHVGDAGVADFRKGGDGQTVTDLFITSGGTLLYNDALLLTITNEFISGSGQKVLNAHGQSSPSGGRVPS